MVWTRVSSRSRTRVFLGINKAFKIGMDSKVWMRWMNFVSCYWFLKMIPLVETSLFLGKMSLQKQHSFLTMGKMKEVLGSSGSERVLILLKGLGLGLVSSLTTSESLLREGEGT